MKTLKRKNILVIALLLLSGVILASSYSDMMIQSDAFMSEFHVDEIRRLDEVVERYVASEDEDEIKLPNVAHCPVDTIIFDAMKENVEGRWMLNKYKYLYGNEMEEEQMYKIVELTMNDNCEVMVNHDSEQIFNISLLVDGKTMALFKPYGEGYEVLELEKIKVKKVVNHNVELMSYTNNNVEESNNDVPEKEETRLEVSLVLESANTPKGYLKASLVKGTLDISEGYLNVDAVINFDTDKEQEVIISDAEINGNAFLVGDGNEATVGVITANGNNSSYTIHFSTGEYKGISLNFVTEEKLESILEQEEAAKAQQEALKRKQQKKENSGEEVEEEEMVTVAQSRGFAF